jgi:hypothetical protein
VVEDDHKVKSMTPEGCSASHQLPPLQAITASTAASPPSCEDISPSLLQQQGQQEANHSPEGERVLSN